MLAKSSAESNNRRANNEGTVYQMKDGRWCDQITVGYKDDSRPERKTVYGNDQKDLLRKMKSMSLNILENGYEKKINF